MLTPEKLTYLLDRMKIQKELEESILRDIARRIAKTDYVTETAAWQAEKAQQAGALYSEILNEVSRATGKSKKETEKLFADARVEIFDAGDKPTRAMERIWQAALTKTFTTAKNLTKTTAITSQKAYIEAADLAHMQIASGAFTYEQAINNAVKRAAAGGVTVRYPSGARAQLDVAIRRAALTGVNQTAGRLCEMRCEELDCDLVEVTAHFGARPSHAEWQGGIYSRSGKHPDYESLVDATDYGSGDGLMGWNCNHSMHPYFEGISVRNYSDEQLNEMKNHTVKYNGKTMTDYEASQKQRSFERQIRETKNRLVALDEAGKVRASNENKNEFAAESVRLKKQEAKLKDFCKQTGRRSDTFRTQKMGFNRSVSGKAVWANRKVLQGGGNGGIINYARAVDIFNDYGAPKNAKITSDSILKELEASPIGKEAIKYMQEAGVRPRLVYEKQSHSDRGAQRGNDIQIFVANLKHDRDAAQAVIHELTHHKYNMGNCQWAEVNCFLAERMHYTGKMILSQSEKKMIIKRVKKAYPELKWKKGGYFNGEKF